MVCINLERVLAKYPVGKTTWYDGMNAGTYPRPIKAGRKSLWLEHEVDAAIERLASQRDDVAARGAA